VYVCVGVNVCLRVCMHTETCVTAIPADWQRI
jgi:hypothetical protein